MAGSKKNLSKAIHCLIITAGMRETHPISIRDIKQPLKYLLRYGTTVKPCSPFNINNFIPSLTKLVVDSPV